MSIQDDIFDVANALRGKPAEQAVDGLMKHFNAMEMEHVALRMMLHKIREGQQAMKVLMNDDAPMPAPPPAQPETSFRMGG